VFLIITTAEIFIAFNVLIHYNSSFLPLSPKREPAKQGSYYRPVGEVSFVVTSNIENEINTTKWLSVILIDFRNLRKNLHVIYRNLIFSGKNDRSLLENSYEY
jgi:hypothetical protein